jgi:hypothetical protein
MKSAMILVAALAALAAPAGAARLGSKITPTEKVINMLTEMKTKGLSMLEGEAKEFATYKEWVDDESKRLGFAVEDSTTKIEELIAFAEKADSDVATLGEAIETLDKDISTLETELKEAKAMRASEHAEYVKVSTDYGESVDALERAVQVMSSENYDRSQAASMLQKMATTVPGGAAVLAAFLQEKSKAAEPGAPEVAAYEFQSGGIVKLLEDLLGKFKGELSDVEESESNQAHEFKLTELHLSDTIKRSNADREEKTSEKAKTAAASAKAKGELAEAKAAKAADEKTLADMVALFSSKSSVFAQNQQVRKEELEALSKAAEIIAGGAVAGSYAKRVNLAQVKAVSLLQMGSSSGMMRIAAQKQAAALLRSRGMALKSKTLLALAESMPADAFAKVIGMIEDLVAKLKEEAAAEADHKAWCDEQLKVNKEKRNAKTSESNKLMAEIEALGATIEKQGEEISAHVKDQQDLTKAMFEAQEIRVAEKAENKAIVEDSAAGVVAVQNALVVLREFYSGQASLLQRQVPELAAYKGQSSAKGGVIGMLEVIETDFARLKAETEASESAAASAYDTFMADSTADKDEHHKAEVKLRLDKDENEFQKSQTIKDLEATDAELAKANEYHSYLKPSCVEVHVSFEERVAGRKAELAALREAYDILDQKR